MKIRINKYDWDVQIVSAKNEKMNPGNGEYFAGLTEYDTQTISIRDGMSTERTRDTVIHELVHAIIDGYGYGDCMNEEEVCKFIASQIDTITQGTEFLMEGLRNEHGAETAD